MKSSGLYKISNIKNGRFYIGSSVDICTRIKHHFNSLSSGKHKNIFLQRDYDKHNKNDFKSEIILWCDQIDLIFFEQRLLNRYFDKQDKCYNLNPIAQLPPSRKGKIPWNKNMIMSIEHRQKLSRAHFGHIPWNKGKQSPKTSGELHGMARPIIAIELMSGIEKIFKTSRDAANYYNISYKTVSGVLTGNRKTAKKKTLGFKYL